MRFKGQTAIVTGGGRDIGAACALKLAAEGANVAVNYYASAAGADKLVAQITEAGGRAFAMKGDEEKIREGGCEGYIAKPISVPTFLETVAKFLD